jgi:predicted lactoylglutathione lyase
MATKIFVNLPVKDLKKSFDFFTKLGYTFNSQFTNEKCYLHDHQRRNLYHAIGRTVL